MDPQKELLWVEFKVCQFRVRGFKDYLDPIKPTIFGFLIMISFYIYTYIYRSSKRKVL